MQARINTVIFIACDTNATKTLKQRYTYSQSVQYGAPYRSRPPPLCLVQTFDTYTVVPRDMKLIHDTLWNTLIDTQRPAPRRCTSPIERGCHITLDHTRRQVEAVEAVLEELTRSPFGGGAILSLPVGYGKTVCGLYIAACLADITLILVHTTALAEQWKSRIEAVASNACVLLASPARWDHVAKGGYTHCVMLMQTLLSRSENGSIAHLFDFVIVDETHHLGAPTLSQCMAVAGARYRLGLSATLERKDGMHTLIQDILGPVAFSCHRSQPHPVMVHIISYATTVVPPDAISVVDMITATAHDEERTRRIADIIHEHDERTILVLSDRKHLLTKLSDLLRVPFAWAIGGKHHTHVTDATRVVLATYAYASEGMDISSLNMCILATSRRDIRQSIGRIMRTPDTHALVFDIVDVMFPPLKRQALARRKWYLLPVSDGGLQATVVA